MKQIFDDDAVYIRLENLAGFRVAWARAWADVRLHKPAANGFTAKHISAHTQRTHSSINTGGRGKPDLKRGRESQSTNGKMPVLPYSSHSLQSQTLGYIQRFHVQCKNANLAESTTSPLSSSLPVSSPDSTSVHLSRSTSSHACLV